MVRITTLRLDRVFGIVQGKTKGGAKFTSFCFESGGKRTLDISVPGWVRVESGMTVTFVYRVKNNAQDRLLGWMDCYGNRVTCTEPFPMLVFALISVAGLSLSTLTREPLVGFVLFGVVALLYLGLAAREYRDHKELSTALESIRAPNPL